MTTPASLPFVIVDVFTQTAGGGNPLAVVFDADGLGEAHMQRIAREFNFSETTFVSQTDRWGCDFRVRIFTPSREVPFAGHPNIGTACVVAQRMGARDNALAFDELAGVVAITLKPDRTDYARLRAPGELEVGEPLPVDLVAAALGLATDDIDTTLHTPCEASVGLPFTMVALRNRQALARAMVDPGALREAVAAGINPDLHCYVREGQDIEARMFAPLDGVPEDPATGSANCALVALLASLTPAGESARDWRVSQGVQMGRPSLLELHTDQTGGKVSAVYLAGAVRRFAEGQLRLD